MELYKTVRREAEATQIIEKSKFTAYVKPVESREDADAFVASIRKKHRDATHNVPAMVIGDKFQIQWASDDGEPQGTSGAPIVQMLAREGVTNVAIVVTRYFGGIKLGTGGLVRAYTSSAKLGLEAAGICSVREICSMHVKVDYTHLSKLQNMAAAELVGPDWNKEAEKERLKGLGADKAADEASAFIIKDIQYTDKVGFELLTFPENEESIKALLANVTSGSAEVSGCGIILGRL